MFFSLSLSFCCPFGGKRSWVEGRYVAGIWERVKGKGEKKKPVGARVASS